MQWRGLRNFGVHARNRAHIRQVEKHLLLSLDWISHELLKLLLHPLVEVVESDRELHFLLGLICPGGRQLVHSRLFLLASVCVLPLVESLLDNVLLKALANAIGDVLVDLFDERLLLLGLLPLELL